MNALAAAATAAIIELDGLGKVHPWVVTSVDTPHSCEDVCDADVTVVTPAGAVHPCSAVEVFGGNLREVDPQPEAPACRSCYVAKTPTTLYLALDERYSMYTVTAVSLEMTTATERKRFQLGAPALSTTHVTEVVLPDLAAATSATVHITFDAGMTESNPIPVLQ